MAKKNFALIGNPNSGKTTLFNQLTGSNQHVGNFPGVTVEKKEGHLKKNPDAVIVDLPGIYSLSPYTAEEVITRDFLLENKPDCIINILDATNIERNLYLTLQLMDLNLPMIIALNMMDEIRSNGNSIDVKKLQEELGIPVVPISAGKNEGIDELITRSIATANEKLKPKKHDFCTGAVHKAIHSIAHIIEDRAKEADIPVRFAATKLVEGDILMQNKLNISAIDLDILGHVVDEMEETLHTDREAALADMRYNYIDYLSKETVSKQRESKEHLRSVKIDTLLTHKYLSLPIFLGIMLFIFWLTFGFVGSSLSDMLASVIDGFTGIVDQGLTSLEVNPWVHGLIINGVFAGVGSVLSFMPILLILFFCLSILEDSGYMARVAFVMDKLLRKIGLSGRSFVPMVIGFGCSVPAIMATRTLPSERDRKMTILLTPFMSCSAKLPVYAVFTAAFFESHRTLIIATLYITGMLVGVLCGLLLKNTLFKGNPVPFVMELPSYRLPSAKSVIIHMWEKTKDFIIRAFTIIFIATIIIWVLQSLDFHLNVVTDSSNSILASLGQLIAPIFALLGFGDWRASTALITGLTAKEAMVSTLAILIGAEVDTLPAMLGSMFTPLQAFSFLLFTLLYMPCVAAMAAVKRELGGMKYAVYAMLFQTSVAWIVSFAFYNIAMLLFH